MPVYQIKTILTADDVHLTSHDKVVYETDQDHAAAETLLAKLGVDAYAKIDGIRKITLDAAMHYLPQAHAMLLDWYNAGTLKTMLTELAAKVDEASYKTMLTDLISDLEAVDYGGILDAANLIPADVAVVLNALTNMDTAAEWRIMMNAIDNTDNWKFTWHPRYAGDTYTQIGLFNEWRDRLISPSIANSAAGEFLTKLFDQLSDNTQWDVVVYLFKRLTTSYGWSNNEVDSKLDDCKSSEW